MKTLFVLRHAKSSWAEAGATDHDRKLNDRGKRDAKTLGLEMRNFATRPETILCSTAKRARKTAKRIVKYAELDLEIDFVSELYLANMSTIELVLRLHGRNDSTMIVGHNPGLEQFVSQMSGQFVSMPTAALAQLQLSIDSWKEFSLSVPTKLEHFWTPAEPD